MATKTKKRVKKAVPQELDSVYFLKIVLYLIVGSQWVWFINSAGAVKVPIPAGLIIGILFASHDHFRLDRKIEYAILLIAMLVGFVTQYGVYITL